MGILILALQVQKTTPHWTRHRPAWKRPARSYSISLFDLYPHHLYPCLFSKFVDKALHKLVLF